MARQNPAAAADTPTDPEDLSALNARIAAAGAAATTAEGRGLTAGDDLADVTTADTPTD